MHKKGWHFWGKHFICCLTISSLVFTLSACSQNNNAFTYVPFVSNLKSDQQNFPIVDYLKIAPQNTNGAFRLAQYNLEQQYIYDYLAARTILLQISSKTNGAKESQKIITITRGTGTILAKAENDSNDFHYYVATNIHVANSFYTANNVQFSVNPFLRTQINSPTQQQIFRLNDATISKTITINDSQSSFIDLQPPTNKDWAASIAWKATKIGVKQYQISDSKTNNLTSPTSITTFTNNKNQSGAFAADLAVLKLDFVNLFKRLPKQNLIQPPTLDNQQKELDDQMWINYKQLFNQYVVNRDVQFSATLNTNGYLAGFSSSINNYLANESTLDYRNSLSSGFVNLQILGSSTDPRWYTQSTLYKDLSLADQSLQTIVNVNSNQEGFYYTPTSNYSIPQLNMQSGASGSIFVTIDSKTKEIQLEGIYWGIISPSDVFSRTNVTSVFGQIQPFVDLNNYNLIGGKHLGNPQTPKLNSLCSSLEIQAKKMQKVRLPSFC